MTFLTIQKDGAKTFLTKQYEGARTFLTKKNGGEDFSRGMKNAHSQPPFSIDFVSASTLKIE